MERWRAADAPAPDRCTGSLTHVLEVLVLALATQSALAQDQILPETAGRQFSVDSRQDGRTVRGSITNGSSMVALTVRVSCWHMALAPACENKYEGKYASLIVDPDRPKYCEHRPQTKLVVTNDLKIMPGKSVELYGELPLNRSLHSCSVIEVRGREKRWLEF